MDIRKDTLDDLLREILTRIRAEGHTVSSTRGESLEIDGAILEITNPRARLSRTDRKGTVFSCLGELFWYLSKRNDLDFITYYIPRYNNESDDGRTVYGGYGPRLFDNRRINQIENILKLLKQKPSSRRAVIQLFNAEDLIEEHKDIPCTCLFQFLIRDNKLNMYTHMRSNDVFLGLPHDVFAFTMIQEIVATELGVDLGTYKHTVTSLHLYERDFEDVDGFLNEGLQEKIIMPDMPKGKNWSIVPILLNLEDKIRDNIDIDVSSLSLDDYWKDIIRLLIIFKEIKNNNLKKVANIKREMSCDFYESYIRKKTNT